MEDHVSPIKISDKNTGITYVLDFCRDSIRFAESKNFDITDGHKQVQTFSYDIFFYAFRMHHKNVARDFTDKLLNRMGGPATDFVNEIVGKLCTLYGQALRGNNLSAEEIEKNENLTVEL